MSASARCQGTGKHCDNYHSVYEEGYVHRHHVLVDVLLNLDHRENVLEVLVLDQESEQLVRKFKRRLPLGEARTGQ